MYAGLLQMHNSRCNGYGLIHLILTATLGMDTKNIGLISTPPTVTEHTNPYKYAAQLQEFFGLQASMCRSYMSLEQARIYLQSMTMQKHYKAAATQLLYNLDQFPVKATQHPTLPMKYHLTTLLITLEALKANHARGVSSPATHQQHHISVAQVQDQSTPMSMQRQSQADHHGQRHSSRGHTVATHC